MFGGSVTLARRLRHLLFVTPSRATHFRLFAATQRTHILMASAGQQRAHMLAEVQQGASSAGGDASSKYILARGCDPVMAARSLQMLPPMVGNAHMEATTDDETFFAKLQERKWDVIFFAPGACRWSAAKQPVPGGNKQTQGWGLDQYHEKVRELQGDQVKIVGTTEERLVVSSLREALGLK
jgi:hypothetical protein